MLIFLYQMILIVTATLMIYRFYSAELRQRSERSLSQASSGIASEIDDLFDAMDTLSTQLISSETLQELFYQAMEWEAVSSSNYFDENIREQRIAHDILWAFNSPKAQIENINMFNARSYVGLRYSPTREKLEEIASDPRWHIDAGVSYDVLPPHVSEWDAVNRKTVFSLFRRYVASDFGFLDLGIIEIEEDFQKIIDICTADVPVDGARILIYDSANRLIYPRETDAFARAVSVVGSSRNGLPDTTMEIYEERYRLSEQELTWAPWHVVVLQSEKGFLQPLREFLLNLIVAMLLLSALLLGALVFIVSTVTKPISQLVGEIDGYDIGHGNPNFHQYNGKEVSAIQTSFEQLIRRLNDSAHQLVLAKETELNLRIMNLQAKIHPHFLFNALSAISSVAMEEDDMKVPVMCVQLADLFRYTSSDSQDENTTLADEIANIRLYMDFMKWRYDENFSYSLSEQGNLAGVKVPKLIFQPLVENSFAHGFQKSYPPFRIEGEVREQHGSWRIILSDNGGGFSTHALQRLRLATQQVDQIFASVGNYGELTAGDQAIANIYIRLKLIYRDALSISLGNTQDGGARVELTVEMGDGMHNQRSSS